MGAIVITLSVHPSVCLSTLRCNAITKTVFNLQTSYFIHRWRIKKGRRLDFGVKRLKVKVIYSDMPPSGALSDCVSFLVGDK